MSSPTFPTVTINGYMVYTAKRWGQFPTISYSNGATAGAEVVTVDSSLNINVQIEDGVSTNAQIKTAIEAHVVDSGISANDLVSIAITASHETDTNVTVKNAVISGGVNAQTASRTIGHLVYTAKTAGIAGNSIRVKYTSGASLTVSVASLDITVQLKNDGSSTNALIKAAIEAEGAANALVACSSDGLSLAFVPTVAMAPAFGALAGGLDAAAPSIVLQDLTFASDKTGPTDNGRVIDYSAGATAGSEVVTVAPITGDIDIQIENGVSTAQQIYDALVAEPDFDGVAASGDVTVTDYAAAHLTAASPSGVLTFGSPSDNDTVILADLPTDGSKTFTKKTTSYATGTITVDNYALLHLTAAIGTIEVVDYTKLTEETATPSGVLTFGAPNNGSTVVVTGPTGGPHTFTKVASDPEAGEFTTIEELTYLINQLDGLDATEDDSDVTLTVEIAGTGPNSWTVTGTDSYSALSITFSGGQDHAVLTVDGTVLTEGTDWDAETSNDATADNIVSALPVSVTGINTSGSIAVTAASAGSAGNSIALVTSDAVNLTISGATLSGGIDAATVEVNGATLTESSEWNAETDDDTTAANIASAITTATATTLCTAAAVATDVVTITSNDKSVAANSITLVTSDAVNLLKSGATLTGGYGLAADEFEVIAELTALIQALADLNATDDATDITITAVTAGADVNSATITGTGAYSALSITFSGGIDAAIVSVNGIDLVESTDWDSVTSNDQAASNLADAITAATATTLCIGVATLAVVDVAANAVDASGNDITLAKTGAGVTVSGTGYLSGGIDGMSVTISGTAGTAQKTVNDAAMSGAVGVNTQGFYSDQSITALTAAFAAFQYPFISRVITIANDETSGTDTVAFSFDGVNIHGILAPAQAITWDVTTGKVIWLKYINGAPNYRLIVKGD